jgi:hypothetical protein
VPLYGFWGGEVATVPPDILPLLGDLVLLTGDLSLSIDFSRLLVREFLPIGHYFGSTLYLALVSGVASDWDEFIRLISDLLDLKLDRYVAVNQSILR